MSVNTIIQHQSLTTPCFVAVSRANKSVGNQESFNDSDLAQQPFNQWLPSSAIRRRCIEWVKFLLATVLLTLLAMPSMAQVQSDIPACVETGNNYDIDFNDNGLIDICKLEQLYNVRYNPEGTTYDDEEADTTTGDQGRTTGAPSSLTNKVRANCGKDFTGTVIGTDTTFLCGYELVKDLDFDTDGDGTWEPNGNTFMLDSKDSNPNYFNTSEGGWLPIGYCTSVSFCKEGREQFFNAVFDGNGHTIHNLATNRDLTRIGLFAQVSSNAKVVNLGLKNNLVANSGIKASNIGGLVGLQFGGRIAATWTEKGFVYGGNSNSDRVGGLVGDQGDGTITASYTTTVGMLGGVYGLGGSGNSVGGLVGHQTAGNIIASYATVDASGTGGDQRVGGLVGHQYGGKIIASYATGGVNAGSRSDSKAGALVGSQKSGLTDPITASWGFGSGGRLGIEGSGSRPGDVMRADQLTAPESGLTTRVPPSWNDATKGTLGAWGFDNANKKPYLKLADYDGMGSNFHCANDTREDTLAKTIISYCGKRVSFKVNSGSDGLIDITTLEDLNNVRYNLKGGSYKSSDNETGNASGCPQTGCNGYELMKDLSFDYDKDGSTWTRNMDGTFSLDRGDSNSTYFDTEAGGWVPIGECGPGTICQKNLDDTDNYFSAIFEGNYKTITGVATHQDLKAIGLFGTIGPGGVIRNLTLEDNLAAIKGTYEQRLVGGLVGFLYRGEIINTRVTGKSISFGGVSNKIRVGGLVGLLKEGSVSDSHTTGDVRGGKVYDSRVGGLIGVMNNGTITSSSASGDVDGGMGHRNLVGGLVGFHNGGTIAASWSTGNADGGMGNDGRVGGLVGWQKSGTIITSWAGGDANGNDGTGDNTGALVGRQDAGSITASWSRGVANGGAGDDDFAGGLVGHHGGGSITASWSLGDADGGPGEGDYAGKLMGNVNSNGVCAAAVIASWGFGTHTGENPGCRGSDDLPPSVTHPKQLTAPQYWNDAAKNTLGAWDFGDADQNPALKYADYDGDGSQFSCDANSQNVHIPNCGTFIPSVSYTVEDATKTSIQVTSAGEKVCFVILDNDNMDTIPSAEQIANQASRSDLVDSNCESLSAKNGLAILSTDKLTADEVYYGYIVSVNGGTFSKVTKLVWTTEELTAPILKNHEAVEYMAEVEKEDGAIVFEYYGGGSLTGECGVEPELPKGIEAVFYVLTSKNGISNNVSCQIRGTPLVPISQTNYTVTATNAAGSSSASVDITVLPLTCSNLDDDDIIDINSNGLIDICSLEQLNNIRHNMAGDSYKTSGSATGITTGCPETGCFGYELLSNLDFGNGGKTWERVNGTITLIAGGSPSTYFDTAAGGWEPIGKCRNNNCSGTSLNDSNIFNAKFDGRGHIIYGVAINRDLPAIGFFGMIGTNAEIRNLGLANYLAATTRNSDRNYIGGLVGYQGGGSIIASWTTGHAYGTDNGKDSVGGLVGYQGGGSIIASQASGVVVGGGGKKDRVGGLVGHQQGGEIIATWARGSSSGGSGDKDHVGGLVGQQQGGSITASYAIGEANGGDGDEDYVGILVGKLDGGSITASYAEGNADGGAGDRDYAGTFLGKRDFGAINSSWGYGNSSGEEGDQDPMRDGSDGRPAGDTKPYQFTFGTGKATDVPAIWNQGASQTLGAWDFDSEDQILALNFADYDGTTNNTFHCTSDADTPSGAIEFPGCGVPIPPIVDSDYDGLIEISTLLQLHNIRHNLTGGSYKTSGSDSGNTTGCPETGCIGYELMNNLDFDKDRDGSAWKREDDGTLTKDNDDSDSPYFDLAAGGWLPIGDCVPHIMNGCSNNIEQTFNAEFDGNGYTINGVFIQMDLSALGLFGATGPDAVIRNLGLTKTFVEKVGIPSPDIAPPSFYIGGLVGYQEGGVITNSFVGSLVAGQEGGSIANSPPEADSEVHGGRHGKDRAGGLVGHQGSAQGGGTITDSHASVNVYGGMGNSDYVGGLVGRQRYGSISDSYATGKVHGDDGDGDRVGGLVGHQKFGAITTSWASGVADGGEGNSDNVGGLLGYQREGSIIDSYATGNAKGGNGNLDKVGGLLGSQNHGRVVASRASGNADGGVGNDVSVGGLVGFQDNMSRIFASFAHGDANSGGNGDDNAGGLVGYMQASKIIASYATGSASGSDGGEDYVGGLVGHQFSGSITASYATASASGGDDDLSDGVGSLIGYHVGGVITASWGFGTTTGGSSGSAGSNDRPKGADRAEDLTAYDPNRDPNSPTNTSVPESWTLASSNTLNAWSFPVNQIPALHYADFDGSTDVENTPPRFGHLFHCAGTNNEPVGAIIVPNCGEKIPDLPSSGASDTSRSYASPAPVRQTWHQPLHAEAAAETTLVADCDQPGASSASTCGNQEAGGADAGAVRVTLTPDAQEFANLIATFDDATHGPVAMRANPAIFELTGIFTNQSLGNWNNFDGQADSARVGAASVSTWQIGLLHDAQATGSITIKGVVITGRFINFLMAGGGTTLDGGRASVGVTLYMAGTGTALATHSPSHCSDRYINGDRHWAHIDVSDIEGMVVDIQIHDWDATSNCGFIAFDHFYQSSVSRGQQAATATRPARH